MINIDCIITEGGTIEATITKDLTINVDIIGSGPQGPIGPKGESAYEHWLSLGNVGTINDFLLTLKGDKGDKGDAGKKVARFVVGTSTAGWTAADCDYLCDGTNDQEEIIQALNDLPATGGEVVILDGTYNITASINIPKDNVSIRGSGNATTLKRMYNSTSADSGSTAKGLITLNGKSGCKIQGLQIDGNRASFISGNNYGIYLYSSSNNTVTGNTCSNNDYGIRLDSSSNNTVTGNTCNNNNYGIYLVSSSDNTVTGNTCNNNNIYGIRLYSSSNNNMVTGNTCSNNDNNGIYLYSSSNNTVTSNTCNNNEYGIYLVSSSNNTITGNTCIRGTGQTSDYASGQYTIRLQGTANNYNLISSNNCMGKAPVVGGGTGNTVINNKWNATSDFEDLRTDVGDKTTLTTTDKTNLVAAINEVKAQNNYLDANKVDNSRVLTDVPVNAKFTDTVTTINGKTGAITKADIVALGIPAQDTVYTHPTTHSISEVSGLQAALDSKQASLGFTPLNANLKGAANGVAELDATGKVPASQLPSYVDDVLEYDNQAGFPATGETGKIYIAKDTNKTYRWSGSGYVEISASLALGTTSSTAFRGDYGQTAYTHSQSAHAPANAQKNSDITKAEIEAKLTGTITTHSHTVTKEDVGLGNVTNESKATMFTNAALTGTPTAPTASKGTNTTQIASTAYVMTALGDYVKTTDTIDGGTF